MFYCMQCYLPVWCGSNAAGFTNTAFVVVCVDTDPNTNSTHVTLVQLCGAVLCKHCLQAELV